MERREVVLTICALMLCVFLAALDSTIVANALPRVIADLQGFELYAWVTTGYLLSSTAVTPIGGKLGDRYGRKPLLIAGAAFFLATTLLCGLAQSMPQLIALRTLQGVGGGLLMASVFALLGELLAPAARARMSGVVTGVFSLAGVIGPVVGGYLTDIFSWRAVFYVTLPIGLAALVVLWRFVPAVRYGSRTARPMDVAGVVTSVGGIVLLLLGLSWGGREYAWSSLQVVGCLAGGMVLLALFLLVERRAADPVLPLSLFRNSVVAISSTNSLAQSMVQMAITLFVPLYAQGVLGTSATLSGTIMLPLLGAMLVSNLASGFLIAHIGRYKWVAVVGFGLACVGLFGLSRLDAASSGVALAACLVVVGSGTGMIFPTLTLSYQNAVGFHELGVATALNQFARSMGSTLGAALFGSLLIARFVPEVHAALPADVSAVLLGGDGVSAAALRDPQSLLNPAAAEDLRASIAAALASAPGTFPNAPATAERVLEAIRTGLAVALQWVFGSAALVSLIGLAGSLIWRDIPLHRGRASSQPGARRSTSSSLSNAGPGNS
jgi:EmrB/QacA subfamily drug resistance transporter